METRIGTSVITFLLQFFSWILIGETCEHVGLMKHFGDAYVGCYEPCNVFDGREVHLIFRNEYVWHTGPSRRVNFEPLTEQKNIVLVLASVFRTKWNLYVPDNLNITEITLMAKAPEETEVNIYFNGSWIKPDIPIIRRKISFTLYLCFESKMKNTPLSITGEMYGFITSYACEYYMNADEHWTFQWRYIMDQQSCIPRRWGERPNTTTMKPRTTSVSISGSKKEEFPESMFIGVMMTAFFGFLPLFLCLCCVCFRARRVRTQPPNLSGFIPVSGSGRQHARIAGAYPPGEFPPTIHITGAHPPKYPTVPSANRQAAEPIAPPPYEECTDNRMKPPDYEDIAGISSKENNS